MKPAIIGSDDLKTLSPNDGIVHFSNQDCNQRTMDFSLYQRTIYQGALGCTYGFLLRIQELDGRHFKVIKTQFAPNMEIN